MGFADLARTSKSAWFIFYHSSPVYLTPSCRLSSAQTQRAVLLHREATSRRNVTPGPPAERLQQCWSASGEARRPPVGGGGGDDYAEAMHCWGLVCGLLTQPVFYLLVVYLK